MLPLLAPVIAQLVTLNVGDRTEVRYVSADESRYEASTRPLVGLNFGWKRAALLVAYTPSFYVTPLERTPRNLQVFQAASLAGTYRWRHTTLTVSEYVGYGEINLRVQALADPGVNVSTTPPTGTTTPGGTVQQPPSTGATPGSTTGVNTPANPNTQATNQLRLRDQIIRYFTWTNTAAVTHSLSKQAAVGADANYTEGRGVGSSVEQYPVIRGARVGAYAGHNVVLSKRDAVGSAVAVQYGVSSDGNKAWSAQAGEIWAHRLNVFTATRAGVGLSATRLSQDDGTIMYTIYPTALAGITHFDRLGGGILTSGLTITAAPFLDPLRATVDPRLNVSGNLGWGRDRFAIGVSAGAALSLTGNDSGGAVNSVGATALASYRLGAGFLVDSGVSTAWQTYAGDTVIPPSWTAFAGITFALAAPLNGRTAH